MNFYETDEDRAFKQMVAEEHASVLSGLAPQTMVMTRMGEAPVEWLESGDEVLTRDRGFVPILWIHRTKFDRSGLRKSPDLAPVTLSASMIQDDVPERDIELSPNQLVLVRSPFAELQFGSNEVLVPAKSIGVQRSLDDMRPMERTTYAHVLLPSHQMIVADRLWLGSLFTGSLDQEIEKIDCPLAHQLETVRMTAARPILNEEEGRMLMIEIWQSRKTEEAGKELKAEAG